MKRYHAGYRYVLLAYATPLIGWWLSAMLHTNPIDEIAVLIHILTVVLGTWFVARTLYAWTKPDAPESLAVLVLPAAILCLIMWVSLLIQHMLVLI